MDEFTRLFESCFTYLHAFRATVERFPTRSALTQAASGRTWTYRELDGECNRLARGLKAAGVRRGDAVMGSLMNTPEFVFFFIATQKAGAVFAPINFRLAPREMAAHIDESRPRAFVYDASLADTARLALGLAQHRPEMRLVVGGEDPGAGAMDYPRLVEGHPVDEVAPEDPSWTDEIVRLYTSGTTGLPKGIPLNNVNNMLRALDVIAQLPLGPLDKTLNTTPWFHSGGLHVAGPCASLYVGAEAVAVKSFDPRDVLSHVECYGVTYLVGSPATIEMLYRAQKKDPRDLRTVKGIIAMGAPLEKSACLRYRETLTPNLYNGYGTTETFWNTLLLPWDLPERAGSVGRACLGDMVRLVRVYEDREHADPDDGVPRDGATEGEIIIRSLKAPFAYHNNPGETRRHYHKGWFYTKDVGVWDQDGFITILGRKDDMIICAGENIHPAQVEAVINQHPQVADSLVVGVPDTVKGRVPAAYVVPADPALDVSELRRFLSVHDGIGEFKRPRLYRFVGSLPMTATGKKQHDAATRMAREDLARGAFKR